MNPLNGITDWSSIGAAAANHLWQSTLFIGVCWLATRWLRKNNASIRHWIWLAASVKFLFPFALLAAFGGYLGGIANVRLVQPEWKVVQSISQPFDVPAPPSPGPPIPNVTRPQDSLFTPWLVAAGWLIGFGTVVLCGVLRWRRLAALTGKASPLREGREVAALRRVQSRHGLRARIAVVSSTSAIEPGVRGIVHPVLFLPAGISDRLSDDQLEVIITHELCHIRRRDNCAAAIHLIVEAIFWFHPLVWWVGSRLVDERERACDEDVLRLGADPQVYAGAILRVCEFYVAAPLTIVSRVTSSNLKIRIEEIMTQRISRKIGSAGKLLLIGAGIVAVAAPIVFGMARTAPRLPQNPGIARPAAASAPIANSAIATPAAPTSPIRLNASVQSAESRQPRGVAAAPSPRVLATETAPPAAVRASQEDYIIGPEDELEIVVWKQAELTRRVVVRPDGKIGIPLLNDVQAAGLTPMQLIADIRRDLKPFVAEPQVVVIVAAAKNPQVSIQGRVARPGLYFLNRPTTVMQLIAQAGGMMEFARREQVAIIRQEGGASVRYLFDYASFLNGSKLEQNLVLKGGDIIVVP